MYYGLPHHHNPCQKMPQSSNWLGSSYILLIRYSTCQHIDNSFKIPIQPTTAKLNTADGSLMIALGMTALHLRIVDFKFTHNFVICDSLLDMEIIFGIDIQKKFSIPYTWDKDKDCYTQNERKFLPYTRNCEQKATISVAKSTLRILPRQNGVVPIKIIGQAIKEQMAYFITNEDSTKGRGPNINIINGIHSIKGKTSVNVLVSNYTNTLSKLIFSGTEQLLKLLTSCHLLQ